MTIRHDRQQKHELILTRRLYRQLIAQQVLIQKYTTKQAASICHCSTRTMRRAIEVERTLIIVPSNTNAP